MSDLQHAFEQAARDVITLGQRPDNGTLLKLYALYKQASAGDADDRQPGFFDVVGAAKHDAWVSLRGTPREEAKRRYVELVEQLLA